MTAEECIASAKIVRPIFKSTDGRGLDKNETVICYRFKRL